MRKKFGENFDTTLLFEENFEENMKNFQVVNKKSWKI